MKQPLKGLLALFLFLIPFSVFPQIINVPGFENLTFEQKDSNYQIAITDSFKLHQVTILPENLTLSYKVDGKVFSLFGTLKILADNDSLSLTLGDSTTAGIIINNGTLSKVKFDILSEFKLKTFEFSPKILGLEWTKANDVYNFYGTASAKLGGEIIDFYFGDKITPGVVFKHGSITQFNLALTADFEIANSVLHPINLGVFYNSEDSQLKIYGDCNFKFYNSDKSDSSVVDVSFGTIDSSKFILKNNSISKLGMNISGSFSMFSLLVQPNPLDIEYTAGKFSLYGKTKVIVPSTKDTIDVSFGENISEGLVIENGKLQSLTLGITGNFAISKINILPEQLTFSYESSNSQYKLFGNCKVIVEKDTISTSLGTSSNPGISIKKGVLQNINFGLTGDFKIKSLTISPVALTFMYNKDSSDYKIFGNCLVKLESDTITTNLGTEDNPGLSIKNGFIQNINFGLTGNFRIKKVTISPNNLTFNYNRNLSQYALYGSCNVLIESDTIYTNLGNSTNPGLAIKDGKVQKINFGITADFSIKGIQINPIGLTFKYDRDSSSYLIYGLCKTKFENEEISVKLGDSTNAGLKIVSGKVEHINFGLTANFKVKQLQFSPKALTFEWDKADKHFEIYGGAKLKIENDSIAISLGDAAKPGVVIKDKKLVSINAAVTADFSIKGLEVKMKNLAVVWNSTKKQFDLYGSAGLKFDSQNIDVLFGDSNKPGLVLLNGSLESFNVAITSNLKLGSLQVKTDSLGCSYEKATKKYFLSGKVEVDALYSLKADFGHNGIEIDASSSPDKLKINDLTVELNNAQLGTIDLKQVKLVFDNNGIKNANLRVQFPLGWQIAAGMSFTGSPQKLNSITIDYTATSIQSAIAIPGTGVSIARMKGSLLNLQDPSKFKFDGLVVLTFAGPQTIGGYQVALAELETNLAIDRSQIIVQSNANLGAYYQNSSWHGLLGTGSVKASLIFGQSYSLNLNVKLPADPLVAFSANFNVNANKDFNALLGVTFYVPHFVPFFGGSTLGGIDGAFRWKNGNMHDSYVAAWKYYHILWKKGYVGAQYNFGSRSLSQIGAGNIDAIRRQVLGYQTLAKGENSSLNGYKNIVHTFNITETPPDLLMLNIKWGKVVDSAYITVTGNDGIYEIVKLDLKNETLNNDTIKFNETYNYSTVKNDSCVTVALLPQNIKSTNHPENNLLVPGEYQLIFSYPVNSVNIDSLSVDIDSYFPSPNGTINAEETKAGTYSVNLKYYSYLDDSIKVDLYWNDTTAYNGRLISSQYSTTKDDSGFVSINTTVIPEDIKENSPIYFYAIIDDDINAPVGTKFSAKRTHKNRVIGKVFLKENDNLSPFSGITVYLDESSNGFYDVNDNGTAEFADITDSTGTFVFNKNLDLSNNINIVVPYGYELDPSSPNVLPYVFDNNTQRVELVYYLRLKQSRR